MSTFPCAFQVSFHVIKAQHEKRVEIFSRNALVSSNLPEPSNRTGSAAGDPDREGATLSHQHGLSQAAPHEMHYCSSTEILAKDSFKESPTHLENDTQEENPRPAEASEGAGTTGWAKHEVGVSALGFMQRPALWDSCTSLDFSEPQFLWV